MEYQNFEQEPSKYKKSFKKESFEFVKKIVENINPSTLLDIGCANGDFIYTLSDNIKTVGLDKSSELINIAKKNQNQNKSFYELDIVSPEHQEKLKTFLEDYGEVVTILGTLQCFFDFSVVLDKVLENKNTKTIIIHSPFNDDPIDVRIFHRDLTLNQTDFQSGCNIFAKKTITDYLQKKGISNFEFMPFEMKEVLLKDTQYPSRNYHLITQNNEKFITNGLRLIFKEYILVINK